MYLCVCTFWDNNWKLNMNFLSKPNECLYIYIESLMYTHSRKDILDKIYFFSVYNKTERQILSSERERENTNFWSLSREISWGDVEGKGKFNEEEEKNGMINGCYMAATYSWNINGSFLVCTYSAVKSKSFDRKQKHGILKIYMYWPVRWTKQPASKRTRSKSMLWIKR